MSDDQFSHELRVRYSECDSQGIVFNANWFMYMDVAMNEFLRETIGGYQHLPESMNVELVVAETGARYRGAARYDEVLTFRVKLARLGTSSLRMEMDGLRGEELIFEGFLEYVCVDANSLTPVPIPDRIRGMLPEEGPSGPATD